LSSIFANDLSDGAECTFSQSADDTEPGGPSVTQYGYADIQRNLDRLEKQDNMNLTEFNSEKCQALHL